MDDDGFAVHSRRRGYSIREPARDRDRATFLREVPKYAGTSEDFDRAHAKRYGREEGLGPDAKHHHGSYYKDHTGGLTPEQHERLDPRAKEYRDKSNSNARNREIFIRAHPHGYHSKRDQVDHHDYVKNAYGEYEYARDQQKHHERYRSYSNVDKRKDQYGRPVSHR